MGIIMQTKTLSKIYGKGESEVRALNKCDIGFSEGSFTAIVGRSGSGKSTLLHLLGGLDMPTTGQVLVEGRELYAMNDKERTIFRRRRLGFIFQFYNLIPELTAYQNIMLPLNLDNRKPDKEYIDAVIETLGLKERIGHYAAELSGGQQQRVAIARALAAKPAVILADEPTGNLDGKSGQEVLDLLLLSRRQFKQTLILVTHDIRIAEGADRLITLDDGLVMEDSAAPVLSGKERSFL